VTTGLHLLRRTPGDVDCLRIRPDLLLEDATDRKLVLVGDAKWKRLYPKRPSLGLNPEDAYQLISYMDRLELTRGFLCFPTPEPMNTVFRIHKLAVPTSGKQISVLEIDVGLLLTPDTAVREEAEANLVCGISTLLPGK
jgi:5-methylcytosine-specific restriction endonuclease McrBC regulatory subunit McrC